MKSNNIIQFPDMGVIAPPPPVAESTEAEIEENKKRFIKVCTNNYMRYLYNDIAMTGFDVYNEDFQLYFNYVKETLTAALYSSMEMRHPLHEVETPKNPSNT